MGTMTDADGRGRCDDRRLCGRAERHRRAAASWCCRRSSASTRTSVTWRTATPRRVISPSRRPCSTGSSPDVELGYDPRSMSEGVALQKQTVPEATLLDVQAAVDHVSTGGQGRRGGLLLGRHAGLCGGLLGFRAWRRRSATTAAASARMLDQKPKVPHDAAFRRTGRAHPDGHGARRSGRRCPTCRSTPIRPGMASTATSAAATTSRAPILR